VPMECARLRALSDDPPRESSKAASSCRTPKSYAPSEGYDPVYGARPLKRFIQQRLETPLSRKIIAGDIAEGSSVEVSVKDGALVFGYRAQKERKYYSTGFFSLTALRNALHFFP